MTAWMLRFISNCRARRNKLNGRSGPLVTEEITTARTCWVRRVQRADQASLQSPGWKLVEDEHTGVLKCEGRVKGYRPTYLPGGPLAEKLVAHVHNQIMHLGVANTMASVRESWWILKYSPSGRTKHHQRAPCRNTGQRGVDRSRSPE
ncbi:uncharacterized protein [Montipora capricornis]